MPGKTFFPSQRFFLYALLAGLLGATLDITAACLQFYLKTGKGPEPVLRYIASALFGNAAFSQDFMPAWGLLFHYVIALCFAFLFFFLALKFPLLLKRPVLSAVSYGVLMWCITVVLVLPLTRVPRAPLTLSGALVAIAILIVCLSIPFILIARNYLHRKNS